jgi:uncharacterized protein YndB with AHSA1/START domain
MSDIKHQIIIRGKEQDVYKALSTIDGLAHWWTLTTTGDSKVGGQIDFRFNQHVVNMRVAALEPGRRVAWECIDPQGEWTGTKLNFDLKGKDGATVLTFGHKEWREQSEFFGHCSMKWATFLLSLKQYVETGAGAPFPNDVAV